MKKSLLILNLVLILSLTAFGQMKFNSHKDTSIIYSSDKYNVIQVSDSGSFLTEMIVQQYDQNQYVNYYRYQMSYNVNGNQTEYLGQIWNNSSWKNEFRMESVYNANGDISQYLYQYYNNNAWANSSLTEYTYDGNGNMSQALDSYWNTSTWMPSYKSEYTYDSQSRLTEQVTSSYSYWLTPPVWTYNHKTTHSYNAQSLCDTDKVYNRNDTTWVIEGRTGHTYTQAGDEETSQTDYHSDSTGWTPHYHDSSGYDSNRKLTYRLEKSHNGTTWENTELLENTYQNNLIIESQETYWSYRPSYEMHKQRIQYTYSGTNPLEILLQEWENSQWENVEKDVLAYDQNNLQSVLEIFLWGGSAWEPCYQYMYTYSTLLEVGGEEIINDFVLYQNYPNPFNSTTRIIYTLPTSSEVTLTLYNIIGEKIRIIEEGIKLPGRHEVVLEDNSLSSGVYFYEFRTPNRVESKKMILLK